MTQLAQHGWGKSDKIDRGLESGSLSGVILSPRDENPTALSAYANRLRGEYLGLTVFMDPQLYAATIVDPRVGNLTKYPYFSEELVYRDFVGASSLSRIVKSAIDFQVGLNISHICSPAIAFESFGDRWNSVSDSLAAESVSYFKELGDERPLLISLVVGEAAFRTGPEFQEFLDIVTDFDCSGFYVLVRRDDLEHKQMMDPALMSELLYMMHVLRTLNDFEVYCGYMDFLSIPLHAAGATATACGWSQGLRRFTYDRFEQSTGGRRPRDRYSSLPLLNSVYINPELDGVERVEMLDRVLSGTNYDGALTVHPPSSAVWTSDIAVLHHWETLSEGISRVTSNVDPTGNLNQFSAMLRSARGIYQELSALGLRLDGPSGPAHLPQWEAALNEFRDRTGI